MNITISVLKMHEDLSKMSMDMYNHLPAEIVFAKCIAGDMWSVHWERMRYNSDFTIAIDEDAFVIRPQSLIEMCQFMQDNDVVYTGMPEKGVSGHRFYAPHSSDQVMNGSFYIINNKFMKDLPSRESFEQYRPELRKHFNTYESYWAIFQYMYDHEFKHINLAGRDYEDKITTILKDFNGNEFLYHTWYARDWTGSNPEVPGDNKGRILKVYNEALARWTRELKTTL